MKDKNFHSEIRKKDYQFYKKGEENPEKESEEEGWVVADGNEIDFPIEVGNLSENESN